jgi:hypothetical protein
MESERVSLVQVFSCGFTHGNGRNLEAMERFVAVPLSLRSDELVAKTLWRITPKVDLLPAVLLSFRPLTATLLPPRAAPQF